MAYPSHIALRYLFAKKSHNVINVVSAVSAAGIAVGAAALIIILSVLNGFNALIAQMLSPIEPDLAIVPCEGKFFIPEGPVFDSLYVDSNVKSMCTVLQDNVFLTYEDRQGTALVKGVDEIYEEESPVAPQVFDGEFRLRHGEIPYAAIGAGLASRLGLNIHFVSGIDMYYPQRGSRISVANPMADINSIRVFPSCRFSISNDIDNSLMIIGMDAMRELTGCDGGEVSRVEIRLRDGLSQYEIQAIKRRIAGLLEAGSASAGSCPLKVQDRYEQNPDLYRMMRMEKASVYLIMLFVVIILGFSIFGSLSLLIIDKGRDIGTLRAMGADQKSIRRIFTTEATLVTVCGMAAGLLLGVVFCLLQQYVGIIPMPGSYIVEYYPLVLEWTDILVAVAGISLAGWVTARLSTRLV